MAGIAGKLASTKLTNIKRTRIRSSSPREWYAQKFYKSLTSQKWKNGTELNGPAPHVRF